MRNWYIDLDHRVSSRLQPSSSLGPGDWVYRLEGTYMDASIATFLPKS